MRGSHPIRPIAALAARQHGNVTLDQLRDLGVGARQVERRVASGWLIPRHVGVFAVGHVPRTRESRWHAAVLALGDEAVLSHRAAAALWGIVRGATPTEVLLSSMTDRRGRDGILVHRGQLPSEHVTRRAGIPVTTLLRTLLDLGTVLTIRRLAAAFEEAQVQHHLPPEPLAAEVLCRRGYRGNARLRTILDGAVDPAAVRSILELRFLRLCAAHGIPRPLVNEKVGPWTPDFLWPDHQVVVETDGTDFHRTPAKRDRDRRKDAYLTAHSLSVTRLTWCDVTEKPTATARRVAAALKR